MNTQQVAFFSGNCPIFKESRQILVYYCDNVGNFSGRKYIHYNNCNDCTLSHNAFNPEECCPIFNALVNKH